MTRRLTSPGKSALFALAAAAIAVPLLSGARTPDTAQLPKTYLTIQHTESRNGTDHTDATLQTLVKFDQQFFCSALIDGRTLTARGTVHQGPNDSYRVDVEFQDENSVGTECERSNLILKPDQTQNLAGFTTRAGEVHHTRVVISTRSDSK